METGDAVWWVNGLGQRQEATFVRHLANGKMRINVGTKGKTVSSLQVKFRASHDREGVAPAPEPRAVNRGPAQLAAVPKTVVLEDEEHLQFVRGLSCCACGVPPPSDPHHYGPRGMGQKTHDLLVVPFCRACHDAFHASRRIPGIVGWDTVEGTHVRLIETQVKLMVLTAIRRATIHQRATEPRKGTKT